MRKVSLICVTLAAGILLATGAVAKGTGSQDVLRLSDAVLEDGEWKVAVHVLNEQELAGMDIPIRFGRQGDAIELIRVDFADRVVDWDFTYAQIDNEAKTVILGLISEIVGTRASADLKVAVKGGTQVATLVLRVDDGYQPEFETFTTKSPGHALTFLYTRYENGKPYVGETSPEFEVDVDFKSGPATLPTEYALSQNFPNPFNPSTSFTLSLPEASDYSIRIFNVAGQLVKSFDGHAEAGVHKVVWHGQNNQGSQVASGAYFYRAEAGGFTETRKMMLLK